MLSLLIQSSAELDKNVDNFLAQNKNVIVLFTGSKGTNDKSWCPDCVVADPIIEKVLDKFNNNDKFVFLTTPVGDFSEWRSSTNQYRQHSKYAVNCVPTLINVSKNQRLEEGGCADSCMVDKLFLGELVSDTTVKAGTCQDGVCRIR